MRPCPETDRGTSDRRESSVYDHDIRPLLKRWLKQKHAHERDTVLLEELGLNRRRVRADIAIVNGNLHGYEIKSERDSLRRLARQVPLYGAVFDRATLVVDTCHLPKARAELPEWWEILTLDSGVLRVSRRGRRNPARTARTLVELIWRDDALELLETRGGARGYRKQPRHAIWDRVCELYSLDEIAGEVRARLKARARNAVG